MLNSIKGLLSHIITDLFASRIIIIVCRLTGYLRRSTLTTKEQKSTNFTSRQHVHCTFID